MKTNLIELTILTTLYLIALPATILIAASIALRSKLTGI